MDGSAIALVYAAPDGVQDYHIYIKNSGEHKETSLKSKEEEINDEIEIAINNNLITVSNKTC